MIIYQFNLKSLIELLSLQLTTNIITPQQGQNRIVLFLKMAGNNTTNSTDLFRGCCQSDRAVECRSRIKRVLHPLYLQAASITTRLMFGILGLITIARVTDVYDNNWLYALIIPVLLLVVEYVITIKYTDHGEWKW